MRARHTCLPIPPTGTFVPTYDANAGKFLRPEQVRIVELLVRVDPAGGAVAAAAGEKKAKNLAARARKGEDLGALAREHSEDDWRVKDGDLGWVHKGRLDSDLESAAFAAPVGEVGSVRSLSGFHGVPRRGTPARNAALLRRREANHRGAASVAAPEAAEKAWHADLRRSASMEILDAALANANPLELPTLAARFPRERPQGHRSERVPLNVADAETCLRRARSRGVASSASRPDLGVHGDRVPGGCRPHRGAGVSAPGVEDGVGSGLEQANNTVADGTSFGYEDNLFSPLLTLQGSVAVLDPRIFNLDAPSTSASTCASTGSEGSSYDDDDRIGNARFDMTFMSGRGAPLRLYYSLSDSRFQQRPLTADVMPLDLARFGEERTTGFAWDASPRRLPRVS